MNINDVSISVENFTLIKSEKFTLNKLNIFIGENNIGKSIFGKLAYCFFKSIYKNSERRKFGLGLPSRDSEKLLVDEVLVTVARSKLISKDLAKQMKNYFALPKSSSEVIDPVLKIYKMLKAFSKGEKKKHSVGKDLTLKFSTVLLFESVKELKEIFQHQFLELFLVDSSKNLRFLRLNKAKPWKIVWTVDDELAIELTDFEAVKRNIDIKFRLLKQFECEIAKGVGKSDYHISVFKHSQSESKIEIPVGDSWFASMLEISEQIFQVMARNFEANLSKAKKDNFKEAMTILIRLGHAIRSEFTLMHQIQEEPLFLPASRSGLLQSLNVLTRFMSSVSLNRTVETSYSGETKDFLTLMISQKIDRNPYMEFKRQEREDDRQKFKTLRLQLIKSFNDIIGGKISLPSNTNDAITYHVKDKSFSIGEVSSMITELIPFQVILQRGNIVPNGLLIIEEPESHLHPEAQSKLAKIIANLLNAGIHLLITTHSPSFYYKIVNLILASQIDARHLSKIKFPTPLTESDLIRPEDTKIWNFKKDEKGYSVTENAPYDDKNNSYPDLFHEELNLQYRELSEIYKKFGSAGE